MAKIAFLAGAGVGYVLGARAGKQRYEQLKAQADKAWHNPTVQNKVAAAQEQVKAKAPVVGQKAKDAAADAAASAASSAKDAASSAAGSVKATATSAKDSVTNRGDKDLPETIHRGEDGELHADTTGFGPGGEKLP